MTETWATDSRFGITRNAGEYECKHLRARWAVYDSFVVVGVSIRKPFSAFWITHEIIIPLIKGQQ
jgi:hypothetical protein